MDINTCPHCGYENLAHRMTCKMCHQLVRSDEQSSLFPVHDEGQEKARRFLENIMEVLIYIPHYHGDINVDVSAVLANLKVAIPDLSDFGFLDGLEHLKLPEIDPGNIDLPDVDMSNILENLAGLDVPDIDLSGLGELLQGVDLSGLGEMLEGIDLSFLGDILEGIDIN